jgi:ribosome-binding factor A
MSSRRLEKITQLIKINVSESIQHHLSDPRVTGLISVTRVDVLSDLSLANIYLSILGVDEKKFSTVITGIKSGSGLIRTRLAKSLTTRSCPRLEFYYDKQLKESFEVLGLLDQARSEFTSVEETEDINNASSDLTTGADNEA